MHIRLLLISSLTIMMLLPSFGLTTSDSHVSAYNPFRKACEAGDKAQSQSPTCQSDSSGAEADPLAGNNGIIKKVATFIAAIAGVIAVITIVFSGILLITSGGNQQKAQKARSALIGSAIGLAIIAAAWTIITFVVNLAAT